MQLNSEVLNRVVYLTGSAQSVSQLSSITAKIPFDENLLEFLSDVSRELMKNKLAKAYSDVITFAYWFLGAVEGTI